MKLFRIKEIIAEVVKNNHISSEIKKLVTEGNDLEYSIEQYLKNTETNRKEVEDALNEFPVEDASSIYEESLNDMIAEEIEAANEQYIVEFGEEQAEAAPEQAEQPEQEEKAMAAVQKVIAYLPGIKTRQAYAQLLQHVLKHQVKDKAMAIKTAAGNKVASVVMSELGEE